MSDANTGLLDYYHNQKDTITMADITDYRNTQT